VIRKGQVGLTWLGQSAFALRFSSARVLIDPFLSPHRDRLVSPPFPPTAAVGFDIIACTHEHLDHLDLDALPAIAEASAEARIVVPEPCVEIVVAAGIAPTRVAGMQPDVPIELSGVTISAVPASHGLHPADAYNFGKDLSAGKIRYLGYVIRGGGLSVYHAGDTLAFDGLAAQLRRLHAEVALLPINGRDSAREAMDIVGNMDAAEAAALAAEAGVKLAVPMHYDMFATNPGFPERMVEAVRDHHDGLAVVVLARGKEFIYTSGAA
jgi:L-ascorbate metabolism protein UlaG (beta-lactamase superfamily)